jgi:replicative DNA helicase
MAVDVAIEEDVLSQALRDPSFLAAAVPVLRRHHFSGKASPWIWKTLQDLYSQTHEVPSAAVWKSHVDRGFKEDADREAMIEALVRLRRRPRGSPRSALEVIRRFVRMAALRGGSAGLFDGLHDDDLEGAEKALVEALAEVRGAGHLVEPSEWALDSDARLAAYLAPESRMRIPMPMDGLNKALGGGMPIGHLGLITAYTGIGKSTFAVDIGFTALMHGEKNQIVIHVCTEEPRRELEARYDARFTGISRGKLLSGDLSAEDQDLFRAKFKRRSVDIGGRLILHEIPPGGPVGAVRAIAEEARGKCHDAPILVIVDSLDHLTPGRKYDDQNREMAATYFQYWAMKSDPTLAPMVLWATANAKQTFEKRRATERAIGGTFEKSKMASVVIGLMDVGTGDKKKPKPVRRPRAADGDGVAQLDVLLSKNRIGRLKNWTMRAEADLGICKFTQVAGSDHLADEDEEGQ